MLLWVPLVASLSRVSLLAAPPLCMMARRLMCAAAGFFRLGLLAVQSWAATPSPHSPQSLLPALEYALRFAKSNRFYDITYIQGRGVPGSPQAYASTAATGRRSGRRGGARRAMAHSSCPALPALQG